jgi:hypothetical protein
MAAGGDGDGSLFVVEKSLAACGMSIKNLKQSSKMQMRNNSFVETWRALELKQC